MADTWTTDASWNRRSRRVHSRSSARLGRLCEPTRRLTMRSSAHGGWERHSGSVVTLRGVCLQGASQRRGIDRQRSAQRSGRADYVTHPPEPLSNNPQAPVDR